MIFTQRSWKPIYTVKPASTCLQLLYPNAKTCNQPSYHLVGEQLIVVKLENGIFFSVTKKWAIKPWKDMEEIYVHIIKWKNPIWKSCTLYACPSFYCMCPFIWQSGKGKAIQKVKKKKKTVVSRDCGGERDK